MMSRKIDNELEKVMTQALLGLKEFGRQQDEKQYKKHWSNIHVPFSLSEGLSTYSKGELDEIRKSLQLKGASSLKKADLIARLAEKIPALLEKLCGQWDEERFGLLTKIALNGGYMLAPHLEPHQFQFFRDYGLIYTGIHNGKKIVVIPNELIESVKSLEKNDVVKSLISRNTEWIKITSGLLYNYGSLSISELAKLLESYTKEPLHIRAYLDVIHDSIPYYRAISIYEGGFSNIRVFDYTIVKQEHEMRKEVPFYPFTKEQLLKAGEPGFVDRNISYVQLVNYLTNNYQINRVEADSIVEECVYATRIGESPNHIMQYLSGRIVFNDIEDVKAIMDKLVILMNNTRQWFLKGHTSIELSKQKKKSLHPLSATTAIANKSHIQSKTDEKIGRNEPCPCGSNKKYKKCCGK
jgi:hypothetical protein